MGRAIVTADVWLLVPRHPAGREAAGVDPVVCAASAVGSGRSARAAARVDTEGERRMRRWG